MVFRKQLANESPGASEKNRSAMACLWLWRLVARTVAIFLFMTGAFLSALIFKFIVLPFYRSSESRTLRVRRAVQTFLKWQLRIFSGLRGMKKPRFEGVANLPMSGPCIIVANHPTLIDILLLGSCRGNWVCIVKGSLWSHFFLRAAIRMAGYVPNQVGSKTLQDCEAAVRQGACLIVFPEGKRSPKEGLHRFSNGAAYVALKTGVPIIPAVIRCNMATLNKELKWYQTPEKPLEIGVRFHEPFWGPAEESDRTPCSESARLMTRKLESWYHRKLVPEPAGKNESGRELNGELEEDRVIL